MAKNVTLEERISQAKFPLTKIILQRQLDMGLHKAADLVRLSGVNKAAVSRIQNNSEKVSPDNIYKILVSLKLIQPVQEIGLPFVKPVVF